MAKHSHQGLRINKPFSFVERFGYLLVVRAQPNRRELFEDEKLQFSPFGGLFPRLALGRNSRVTARVTAKGPFDAHFKRKN